MSRRKCVCMCVCVKCDKRICVIVIIVVFIKAAVLSVIGHIFIFYRFVCMCVRKHRANSYILCTVQY